MLKDHKRDFRTSTPCRLLTPFESKLGKISKLILERANKYLVDLFSLNQWKNSNMVINWFRSIKKKKIAMCIHSTGYYGILSLSNGNDTR